MAELGALSLRIETVGDKQALTALDAIDVKAKGVAGTEQKLTASQKALNREIAEGTRLFALQGRTIDATSDIAVNELRASAAAQKQWLQQIGASTIQQEQFNRAVQQFEQRIGVFGGSITNAQGRVNAFGRSGLNAFNALAFGISQMAATGTASFRSLATSMTSVLAFFGSQGAIAAGVIATGLVLLDFFTRTRREIEETAKKAKDEVAGLVEAFRQRDAVQVIEDGLKAINAQLKTNRENRAAIFDIQARTDAAGFTHPIDEKKLAELTAERLKLQQAETELILRLGAEKAKSAKTDEDAEQKRLTRLAAQIANLKTLEGLQKLTATDMVAVVKLEGQLRAELKQTNITLERRATILQQLKDLGAIEARKIPVPGVRDVKAQSTPQAATTLSPFGALTVAPPKVNVADPLLLALEQDLLRLASSAGEGASLRAAAQQALDSLSGQMGPLTFTQSVEIDLKLNAAAAVDQAFATFSTDVAGVLIDAFSAVFEGGSAKDVILKGLGGIFAEMGKALLIFGLTMQGLLPAFSNPLTAGPAAIAAGAALLALGTALGAAAGGKGGGAGAGSGGGYGGSSGGGLDTIRSYVTGSDRFRGLNEAPKGLRDSIGDLRRSTFGADAIGALSPRTSLGSLTTASAPANPWSGMQFLVVNTPAGQSFVARDVVNAYNRDRGGR